MTDPGLLTPDEHRAVAMAGELWSLLCAIAADGPAREGDLNELAFHIHAIQRAVLKQAAARAYPGLYRLLGGFPVIVSSNTIHLGFEAGQVDTIEGTSR